MFVLEIDFDSHGGNDLVGTRRTHVDRAHLIKTGGDVVDGLAVD